MEAYRGLAILTTNLKSSLDKAFQRRLRFSVNFPFPGRRPARGHLEPRFPREDPDRRGRRPQRLAQLNMAGGNIRNIATERSFPGCRQRATRPHGDLLEAARLEAQKIERPLADAEVRGWL